MPGFLIPLAGLALGALGRLINNRRSQDALSNATTTAVGDTPSETNASTVGSAATAEQFGKPVGVDTNRGGTPTLANPGDFEDPIDQAASNAARGGPIGTQPATGPVQQNQGSGSPPSNDNAGLAARLGRAAIEKSRKRNVEQQGRVSNAALR